MTDKPKRHERHDHTVGALMLMLAGAALLMQQMKLLPQDFSWWALFILIPGLGLWWRAFNLYQETEAFSGEVTGLIAGGLIPVLLGLGFMFNFQLGGSFWALLLIVAGAATLLRSR